MKIFLALPVPRQGLFVLGRRSLEGPLAVGMGGAWGQVVSPFPQKSPVQNLVLRMQKAANVSTLAAFVGRTPGSGCYRCFLSNLTGLAVLPPSGLRAS